MTTVRSVRYGRSRCAIPSIFLLDLESETRSERWISLRQISQLSRECPSSVDQERISQGSELQRRQTGLQITEQIAWSTQGEIELGQFKTIRRLLERGESLLGQRRPDVGDGDAEALLGTATNPATQLVELSETEVLGPFDHEHRRIRHVDPHFDQARCDEELELVRGKALHDRLLVSWFQAAVEEPELELGEARIGLEAREALRRCSVIGVEIEPRDGRIRFDSWADDEHLAASGELGGDEIVGH